MIIPSIDLMGGKAVQLRKGKEKILEEKNLNKLVRRFKLFPVTNVIDLDSALGIGENKELVKILCSKLRCNVGGGIRSLELANEFLRAGAKKIIVGTNARIDFLKKLPKHRVIVALDVKNKKIVVEGWKRSIDDNFAKTIRKLENYCSEFLITNVDVEGCNNGTNMDFIKGLQKLTKNNIIVAGGISKYDEIAEINNLGFDQVLGMSIYKGNIDLYEAFASCLDFSDGLIPTIVQDLNGKILMQAYSNKESVLASFKKQKAHFFSRKRNKLWLKGETSGNYQLLKKISYDCDSDSLLFFVSQLGNACHTSNYSCFKEEKFNLAYLLEFLRNKNGGYTGKLLSDPELLKRKIMEEAYEVVSAKTKQEKIWEFSDVLYFIMVYMVRNKLSFDDIENELSIRHL